MNFLEMWMYHTDAANAIRIAGGHYPPISDLHNRVAAGVFQRFQNTMLCSAGIGAAPQQAEIAHFHISRNGRFGAYVLHMHCLPLVSGILGANGYPDFYISQTGSRTSARRKYQLTSAEKLPDCLVF